MMRWQWCVLFVAFSPGWARAADAPGYQQAIAPLLTKYCVGCHNSDDHEAGLVLESFATLSKGSENGSVVAAGKPDDSKLLLVLTGKAEPAMPPEGSAGPTPDEIAILRAWIEAGAPGPTSDNPSAAELVVPAIPLRAKPPQAIHSAAWSPDGKSIAAGGYRQIRLLSVDSRGLVRRLPAPSGNVTDLAFSADGKQLFAAGGEPGRYGEVVISDVETGAVVRTIRGHKDSLYALAVSPDGKTLATGSYDQLVQLWDVASGEHTGVLEGHSGAVFDLAFHPDGRLLASASADRTVKLWDVAARKRLDTFAQALQEQNTVAFSPDGRRVAAGGADNRIRVWEVSSSAEEGTNPIRYSKFAHQTPILKLAYSPNGKVLASVAEDRTLRLYDAAELNELRSLEVQPEWAPALTFSPDSKRLFAGRADGSFTIYEVASGEPARPAAPELVAIEPRGVERGTTSRRTLVGKNLLGATTIATGHESIVATIAPDGISEVGDRVTIDLTPAASTPRGPYDVTIVTPGGKSKAVRLYVDDIPQQEEVEPNAAHDEASIAALPISYWGTVASPGDDDYFRFEAAAGSTIVFELAAKSLGSKLNGVLTLLDATGAVVATNNDFDSEDPLLAHTFATSGVYAIRVSDLTLGGSPEHTYRLSLGPFAYVTSCFPLGVSANQESQVELVGYNLPSERRVRLPAKAEGEITVPIDAEKFRSHRPLNVVVSSLPESVESEPNDRPESANVVAAPVAVNGRIEASSGVATDVDLIRFSSKAGQTWIVETEAARRGSPIDTRLEILDAQGRPIERVLLQAVRDSAVNFRNINSQVPEVRVDNWEEMELNEYLYMGGEVCKIFRLPQGPDSGFQFYSLGGSRLDYFDTSATAHAVADACYIVVPHAPGTPLPGNGLPVFPIYYTNDDDGLRRLGRDSRVTFVAPADGEYLVRVSDVRAAGSERHAYRLLIREPRPDFQVSVSGTNPTVPAGGGRNISFNVERIDGFDDEIRIDVTDLPPGFSISTPVVVEAGHFSASAVLYAAADATKPAEHMGKAAKVTATAVIQGSPVTKEVGGLGEIRLAPQAKLSVRIEPAELTIAPGGRVTALLKAERNGYEGRITFNVQNLPHGVIVDNIGLNGVLIPEGQSEREVFLTARNWVPETTRPFFALTQEPGGEASPPAVIHVRRSAAVAQAESAQPTEQQQ
jgi:WD40 repeat protein